MNGETNRFIPYSSVTGVISGPEPLIGRSRIDLGYGLKTNQGKDCTGITLSIRFTGYTQEEITITGCSLNDVYEGYQQLYAQHKRHRGNLPDEEKTVEDMLITDLVNNLYMRFKDILISS